MTIPIFNSNSTKKAIELDKLELDKIKIENERRNQELPNRQLQMSIEIKNKVAQVSAAESSLESAILAYENSSLLFSEGQISSLDFFRVRNQMITAESELKQAVFSLELSQVVYSILNGR